MEIWELQKLKRVLDLEDLGAEPGEDCPFFWNVALDADELPGWRRVSSQSVTVAGLEQIDVTVWMPQTGPDRTGIRIDVSAFASRALARQGLLKRVASAHVPTLKRLARSEFGEIEFRSDNGGVLIFGCGNLVATLARLGPGGLDIVAAAHEVYETLHRDLDEILPRTRALPAATRRTGRPTVSDRPRRRLQARANTAMRLESVEPAALGILRAPPAEGDRPADATAPQIPPWPVSDDAPHERFVLLVRNGRLHVDGAGVTITPSSAGETRVTMLRGQAGAAGRRKEEWFFDVQS